MKIFNIPTESDYQIKDIYEWCRSNIGPEYELWWSNDHYFLNGRRYTQICIEDEDQETLFVLRWGNVII